MSVVINGSAGVTTNSGAVYNGIASGTAVASTSGTSIDFTSIPSWVKRITVMLSGVSTSGGSVTQVQIGSGSVTTTGYNSTASYGSSAGQFATLTSGFPVIVSNVTGAAAVFSGVLVLNLISSNTWVVQGANAINTANISVNIAGTSGALSGTLDRIRVTTVNGTDTFDAGSINILYE
jgi:hypothetical protein